MSKDSQSNDEHRDDDLDLEREWAEARQAAGLDAGPRSMRQAASSAVRAAEFSPYALLYTGFLLGPAATLVVTLLLIARHFELRAVVFAVGVCGVAWSGIQAATFGLAGQWSVVELQMLRTGVNFAGGLLLLWFLAKQTDVPMGHDRQTIMNTIVLVLLLVLGYTFLTPDVLIWLGR